jgi:hypothetical protein
LDLHHSRQVLRHQRVRELIFPPPRPFAPCATVHCSRHVVRKLFAGVSCSEEQSRWRRLEELRRNRRPGPGSPIAETLGQQQQRQQTHCRRRASVLPAAKREYLRACAEGKGRADPDPVSAAEDSKRPLFCDSLRYARLPALSLDLHRRRRSSLTYKQPSSLQDVLATTGAS